MKTKLILPGMVALTFHAFLLFGLTGKTPPAIIEPEVKPPDLGHAVPIDQDDLVRASAKTDDEPSPSRGGPVAPRRDDIPVVSPPHGAFTIPALPPVKGEHTISVIPVGWENPAGPGKDSASDAVDLGRLDRIPRTRSQPAPDYPANLRIHGIEGTVVVEFLVDTEGNVHNPIVLRASHPEFIEPALHAGARWKFEPGYSSGRKVRFRMSVPLVFTIEGK